MQNHGFFLALRDVLLVNSQVRASFDFFLQRFKVLEEHLIFKSLKGGGLFIISCVPFVEILKFLELLDVLMQR
jgi:hypothetical protein